MLPIVLVLFVASSAFAAPSTVEVNLVEYNEVPRPVDSGALVSGYLIEGPMDLVDGGDINIYIRSLQDTVKDLANQGDPTTQAIALSQILGILGELATGVPGDSCAAANLINVYTAAVATGNYIRVGGALSQYLSSLLTKIDLITQLNANNNNLKYASVSTGSCAGNGRSYNFEGAWSTILDNATPAQLQLLNEAYCSARRLYNAWNVRSNNVGALVTAASLRPVTNVIQRALTPVANFLRAVAAGVNASSQAAVAKQAIILAASTASY